MNRKTKPTEGDDEMRPEYDLSKLKLVGRGIYVEGFRRGTNLAQLIERDCRIDKEQAEVDDLRPDYDFRNMRTVRRGPARKRARKER